MRALRLHLTLPSAVGVFGSACRVSFAEPAPAAPGPPLHAASPPAPPRVTFEPCADAACGESSSRASILDTHAPTRRRVVVPPRASDCAPDRAELGRAAWSFLHTTAAYFPDAPTPSESAAARALVDAVAILYPCAHCREGFAETCAAMPPDVSSRRSFAAWLCAAHNAVNEKLGKPAFTCDDEKLHLRWRALSAACNAERGDAIVN